jgi:NADPH:quinone reductase
MTAAVGLYMRMGLPEPWNATTTPTPLIVYGASGAVVRILANYLPS